MLDATDMNNLMVLIKAEVRQQLAPILAGMKSMGNTVSTLEINQFTLTQELEKLQAKVIYKASEKPEQDET